MKQLLLLLSLLTFTFSTLSSQCYDPQLLDLRLGECGLVVTGRINNSTAYYNDFGHIDTRHELEIFETWFGDTTLEAVNLITNGGRINEEMTIVRPAMQVQEGDMGVFLLRKDLIVPDFTQIPNYRPVAMHESLLRIDTLLGVGYDQDSTYENLDSLYFILQNFFQQRPHVRQEIVKERPLYEAQSRSAANITSFSPTNTTAGTGQVLTINGNGFGSSQGTVFFDSPDDGTGGSFISAPEASIISWTNNQIRVEVFGRAGTGRFQVRTSSGMTAVSNSNITIRYAITNLQTSGGDFITARLVDDAADGDGGYDYLLSTSTANGGQSLAGNPAAVASLRRAFEEWQNDAGYSIFAGIDCGTTAVQTPVNGDGVNVISFGSNVYDFDNRHGNGTVGVAFSYYSACGSSEFEMIGNDIMFRRDGNPNGTGGSINWNFGPGPSAFNETSFESVALHEIGHTHQLGHVASADDVMNFRVLRPALEELSNDDLAGAAYVSNIALNYNPPIINCGSGNDFNRARAYESYDEDEDCAVGAPLPVTLLNFTGRAQQRDVALFWATTNEINNDHFNIERSTDGRSFASIGRVAGRGNTRNQSDYLFTDSRPSQGDNFYRLAQVDFDGTVNISPVVRVNFAGEVSAGVEVFPNPVASQLNVTFAAASQERILEVYDNQGRLLLNVQVAAGLNRLPLSVNELPSGVYLLRMDEEEPLRFVKE